MIHDVVSAEYQGSYRIEISLSTMASEESSISPRISSVGAFSGDFET